MFKFYEFFSGGGMARSGLGQDWDCTFANDIDQRKANSYVTNWGNNHFYHGDIKNISVKNLIGHANLLWASFPCQDLSLAGNGLGLEGKRSSTVSEVWRLISGLNKEGRSPDLVVFENVCGLVTSRKGQDFQSIATSFRQHGYRVGAIVLDASTFLPQSRKRVFFVGCKATHAVPDNLFSPSPPSYGYPQNLVKAVSQLKPKDRNLWTWWHLPSPVEKVKRLGDLLDEVDNHFWHSSDRTTKLIAQMNDKHLAKLSVASSIGKEVFGTVFRRTRIENEKRIVRAEVRFDGIAGCLRTPNGGSSKQILISVDPKTIKTRDLTGRECARLMGFVDKKEHFNIPVSDTRGYKQFGNSVVVPAFQAVADLVDPHIEEILSKP